MDTRIYAVTSADGKVRLVDAASPAQALRHVAQDTYEVSVARPKVVAAAISAGVQLERSGANGQDE